jgi:hypothetical protein
MSPQATAPAAHELDTALLRMAHMAGTHMPYRIPLDVVRSQARYARFDELAAARPV